MEDFARRSPPARRALLHALLDQLHRQEWRDVRDRLNRISFHQDILASLPLELAVHIIQYFHLSELYTLRRVSHAWNRLLSTPVAHDVVFRKYTGRHDALRSNRLSYARQRLRLERGDPVSNVHNHPDWDVPLVPRDYSSGRCVWIEAGTSLVVLDLRSQGRRSFCTENRDSFVDVRLSESILAAITARGYCLVWDLSDPSNDDDASPARFRMPSLNYSSFTVAGVHVAITTASASASDHFGHGDSVVHWDLSSQVARTIPLESGMVFLTLNPAADALHTVYLERKRHPPGGPGALFTPSKDYHLRIATYPFRDVLNPRTSDTLALPAVADHLDSDGVTMWGSEKGFNNRCADIVFSARSQLQPLQPAERTADDCLMMVSYDRRVDRFAIHSFDPAQYAALIHPDCMVSIDNLLYYITNDNGKPRVCISNPDSPCPHRPAKGVDPQLPREPAGREYSYSTRLALMGDRDFLLLVDENGLKVWRFGEDDPKTDG
ncbi:hypothetical protein BDV59DRAFT_211047 [Aspergillus ambiguus]|uniref:F-box domain protein n=1 Tax=Aspergillus ambiguus TaxID=176160 RepID=UPI003CCD59F7